MQPPPLLPCLLLGVLAIVPSTQSPSRPDFRGEWTLDPSRTTVTGAPVRLSGQPGDPAPANITAPVKIVDVPPLYPTGAMTAKREGRVILEAMIDINGSVVDVNVLRSAPEFDEAAANAVAQWKYRPAMRNGVPIPTIMSVVVTFAIGMPGTPRAPVPPSEFAPAAGRGSGQGGGNGLGPIPDTLSITQDASGVKVTRRVSTQTDRATYRFDGRKTDNHLPSMGGLANGRKLTFVSRWDDSKLVTDITWNSIAGAQRRTETIALDGDALMIELTRPPLQAGGEPIVRRTAYLRAKK
jgi:TonB family protein